MQTLLIDFVSKISPSVATGFTERVLLCKEGVVISFKSSKTSGDCT